MRSKRWFLTQIKGMKDLTIINGANQDFIFIDADSDTSGIVAYFINSESYLDGYFEDQDLIKVEVEYQYQALESVSGWEYPQYTDTKVYPGDESFDYDSAYNEALEAAKEILLQKHDVQYVEV
ncbi:hypothetical protein DC487_01110 [Sphingobacterium corticibacter]|uniref:Uncharacterized protein n=2 Tax=Sphingobacterium corticibacter TaxID=2171749 RepID=A0A2T8HLH9_9SPHI|nr:hypothetical protein DC487_01110 [Sphingobacterium corticibacter]